MSKSLGNSLLVPAVLERVRGIELRFYMVARALPLARGVQLRGARRGGRRPSGGSRTSSSAPPRSRRGRADGAAWCAEFVAAMDDDLGTPAAVAVDPRRGPRGQQAARRRRLRRAAAQRRLGARHARRARARPGRPGLGRRQRRRRGRAAARRRRRTRRRHCSSERAQARADKDWARADAIRDRIKAAGIEIEDTPPDRSGRWSLSTWPGNSPAQGRDPQDGQGARRPARAAASSAASRARARRRRPRTGPTTRPTRREARRAHQAHRPPGPSGARRSRPTPSGWPGATPSSRRCGPACRSPRVYVAEGAERDGRLREAFKIAAERAHACWR